jgi:hypothetical protein
MLLCTFLGKNIIHRFKELKSQKDVHAIEMNVFLIYLIVRCPIYVKKQKKQMHELLEL